MKKLPLYSLLFLLCLFTTLPLFARVYTFRGISMSDGLSDLLVNVIYKDAEGFVWLGTDNSLDRFDGVKIKHYSFNSTDARRMRVNAIAEVDSRYLWVGNGLGLWRLDRQADTMEQVVPETIDCMVSSLYFDKNQRLYIGTERGLFIFYEGAFKKVMIDPNTFSATNNIVAIEEDESGRIWLLTEHDLYTYNPLDEKVTLCKVGLAAHNSYLFNCITRIGQTLYLGTINQGIIRYDIEKQRYSHFVDVGCNIISSISSCGDMIYVSTDGNGVHFLSHSKEKILRSFKHDASDKASIRSNSVYSLLVDKENIVWIGFYQSGFDYSLYQSELFTVYAFPPFDSMNMQVRSFLIDEDKRLIGTRDGLFYIDEKTGVIRSFVKPVLHSNLILALSKYEEEYYIGTYGGGLSVLNPVTLTVRDFAETDTDVFQKGHVFCLTSDSLGNLWIGTSEGLFCYNKSKQEMRQYTNSNSQLPEGNVYEVFFDSSNKGWICTEEGLALYDPASGSIKTNVFPEGFVHKEKIRTIYEDSGNLLYFLPDKGSMLTSDLAMTHFYRTSMNPTLNGNAFMSVVEDDSGWLWFGCDDGMIQTKERDDVYFTYNFSDGIPSPTFTNGAAYKDPNGVLWFGNSKGLLFIDTRKLDKIQRNPYRIVFTDIQVNGQLLDSQAKQEILDKGSLTVKHNQRNFMFLFANLSYTEPNTMVYEYKLDGWDKEWMHISGRNWVSYYDIPVGSYTFRVRRPGNEESEVFIHLTISPLFPVWLLVVLLVLVIVLYWVVRSYITRFKVKLGSKSGGLNEISYPATEKPLPISSPVTSKKEGEKYKTNRLTAEECKELHERLTQYMKREKPYTNPDLKIGHLAQSISTSSHSLSYVFNQYMNQSYYDFINEYRIEEFKGLVNNPQYAKYTLSALAELCGFSSRASFFRSFKKITGITPNEYIRTIGGNNE